MFVFKKHSSEFLKKPKNKEETEENSLLSKHHYQQICFWHILSDIFVKNQTLHYLIQMKIHHLVLLLSQT